MRFVVPGYERIAVGNARGMALPDCRAALEEILATDTLHSFAARHPSARAMRGRATVYAIPLPPCGDVVVRHSMRGGAAATLLTDLFLPPTRALRELVNSLRLRSAGVFTPQVVGYVTYRVGPVLRRSDVVTREIPDGANLAVILREIAAGPGRDACLASVASLLAALTRAGAHHPDLNIRNVLVSWSDDAGPSAWVLDVDRVRFNFPGDPLVAEANLARLERSLRKARESGEAPATDAEIAALRAARPVVLP